MKKQIYHLIIAFLFASFSFAQATLEHSYSTTNFAKFNAENEAYAFYTQIGLNYFTFDFGTNTLQVYNESHSLTKTIVFPNAPIDIILVTDNLFNNDNVIEILYSYATDVSGYEISLKLINENGLTIQTFSDKRDAKIIKNNNSNFKLIVSKSLNYGGAGGSVNTYDYDVYALSGTLTLAQEQIYLKSSFAGFPNPTENIITISNNLENKINEILEVFDSSGKKVKEETISDSEQEIILDINNLSTGIYIYKLNGQTNRFVKK